jgi:3-(3-hydroxy-phenyl)propionate hydroxylase
MADKAFASSADLPAAREAASGLAAPVRVIDVAALAGAGGPGGTGAPDAGGAFAKAGLAGPGEVWVIRPDAHAAAVLHRPGAVWVTRPDAHAAAVLHRPGAAGIGAALRRALGMVPAAAS